MRLFRFQDPQDFRFARAGRRGAWHPDPGPGVCPECGAARQQRIPPLIIEWLPDSDLISDFVWPGLEIVVSQNVRKVLEERFQGFEFKSIEMWQDPQLKHPQRMTKRTQPRVWLPYEGPPLYDLWVTTWMHVDHERSSIKLIRGCSTCGGKTYEVNGVEIRKHRWNRIKKELVPVHIPRVVGKGIYINREDLREADIFGVYEFPAWVFCTERVKQVIEEKQFTNVSFLEMGETF